MAEATEFATDMTKRPLNVVFADYPGVRMVEVELNLKTGDRVRLKRADDDDPNKMRIGVVVSMTEDGDPAVRFDGEEEVNDSYGWAQFENLSTAFSGVQAVSGVQAPTPAAAVRPACAPAPAEPALGPEPQSLL